MKSWFIQILFFSTALIVFSCDSTKKDSFSDASKDHGDNEKKAHKNYVLIDVKNKLISYAEFGDVGYSIKAISALDFLEKQGKKIDENDIDELHNESVIIMEFKSLTSKDVTDLAQIKLTDDDLMMYLSGSFNQNIHCIQEGKTQIPSGAQLDGSLRIDSKIKILLFGLNIDLSKPFELEYFDAIFGAGKMIFEFNENKSLV
ncbi:MAG: hypothetical protein COA32_15005 [Fluviicola sp.]|nr:MAG: hypothetical protein COA32_15005 [Fluviicola sp.]